MWYVVVVDFETSRVESRIFESQRVDSQTDFGRNVSRTVEVNIFDTFVAEQIGRQVNGSGIRSRQSDRKETECSGAVKDIDHVVDGDIETDDFQAVGR